MEMRGSRPNSIQGTIHGPGYSGDYGISATYSLLGGQTFEEHFHVFAVDWEANSISWSVDDEIYLMRTPDDVGDKPWVFDHPFNLIINLAVGGTFDEEPNADVMFPKRMVVDWVRVYDKAKPVIMSYPVLNSVKTNFGNLVWVCEFNEENGTLPDSSKWNYDLTNGPPEGWGNSELEYYTNETLNCATNGFGQLVITARSDNAAKFNCRNSPCLYTSARLTTREKFNKTYGRFEAKLKFPSGKGLWPAFWLMGDNFEQVGWPNCGVIAFEMRGSTPNLVTLTIHGPGYSGGAGIQSMYYLPIGKSFSDDFHVFTIDWQPFRIKASVDGNSFSIMTRETLNGKPWVFDHPFRILTNLAVGGLYDGDPDPIATVFPSHFFIDYIRVYDQGDIIPSDFNGFSSYSHSMCPV
ncbi:hypothetical protein CHUAL_012055 [Chamberlinius hualienensis]